MMGEMSRKVGENLRMRQDKAAMARAGAEQRDRHEKNGEFFEHVEGLGALDVAVDGLYVRVQPRLGLSHTQAGVRPSLIGSESPPEAALLPPAAPASSRRTGR